MANTERNARPSLLNRILARGLWISAAATALAGWLRGAPAETAEPGESEVTYERSDINAHAVILAAFGILLFTWIIVGLLYVVFAHFVGTPGKGGPMEPPAAEARVPLPPDPRLETSPRRDYEQVRGAAVSALNSYGWADRAKGIATIPIERAIALTAQRGIPPQGAPAGMFYPPRAGSRLTGFEPRVEAQPR